MRERERANEQLQQFGLSQAPIQEASSVISSHLHSVPREMPSRPRSAKRDVSKVPGSASTEEEYTGSRKMRQRFEYGENSTAGFVELAPDRIP